MTNSFGFLAFQAGVTDAYSSYTIPLMLAPAQPSLAVEADHELLGRYVSGDDREALAELIQRYAPIVYSSARRQTRNSAMAEDISQCVFVALARKAKSIRSASVLGAWLMQTTRYTAANAMKVEARRRRHEQAAGSLQSEIDQASDPAAQSDRTWLSVEPVLDAAISRLSSEDQSAIVLKFFRGMTSGEIAAAIGITEEAVRKRVSRAIERLRGHLASAGVAPVACTAPELARLLASNAVVPAPPQLIAHAAAIAASAGKSVPLIHAIIAMTTTTKSAIAIGVVIAVLLCGAGIVLVAGDYFNFSSASSSTTIGPSADQATASPNGPMTLDIRAIIDGSDVLKVTPDGAAWTHLYWDPPSGITLNGEHTSPTVRTSLAKLGLSNANLSSATVVSRRGRGLVALDKTATGIAIHFDDPDGGAAPYQISISFQPKSSTAAPTTLPALVNPATLDIKARICGADLLTITARGAHWKHLTAGWPDNISVNGKLWNARTTPANDDPIFTNLDLASAQVVARSGRDSVVMEKTANGLAIYFSDTFGGLSDYEIKVQLSTLK
jgi:RNA polymerase sigma factor (sigma-70 family)